MPPVYKSCGRFFGFLRGQAPPPEAGIFAIRQDPELCQQLLMWGFEIFWFRVNEGDGTNDSTCFCYSFHVVVDQTVGVSLSQN